MATNQLYRLCSKTVPKQAISKGAKYSTTIPELPKTDHTPLPYSGPDYETTLKIRKKNLNPCLTTFYKQPLMLSSGHMQWLYDVNGQRYLDMFGGIVTVSVGHCHPKVTKAATEQLQTLWHSTNIYLHPKLHEYASKLASKMPGDLKVVYLVNSGSEANDLATLMARRYTRNNEIIALRNGYHGMSQATMTLTASKKYRYKVPYAPGAQHAMNPNVYAGLWGGKYCRDSPIQTLRNCNCKDSSECQASTEYYKQFEELFSYTIPKGGVAAFIAESIQGVGGTVQFPKGYIKQVAKLTRENGGLYIADEVQTGFGRTGDHFWGFEAHDTIPDIVTMAKGIGNGYPLGAVVTTPEVASSLHTAAHFNTFGGNPVASAVGLSVLEVIEEEQLQEKCKVLGTYFLKELAKLRDEYECVGDVRGKGLMIGVELVENKESRKPMPADQVNEIHEALKDAYVLVGKGGINDNALRIKPPMCITKEDVDYTLAVFRNILENHQKKY